MCSPRGDRRSRHALLVLVLLLGAVARPAAALDLSATRWEAVARRHAIDPLLLYALALHETHRPSGGGMASPWPWTLGLPEGVPR